LRVWRGGIGGWNAFAAMILALDWLIIWTTPQRKIRERAQQEDLSRLLIFIFVVVAACAALFAVGFLIRAHKDQIGGHLVIHLLLPLLTRFSPGAPLSPGLRFRFSPRAFWAT